MLQHFPHYEIFETVGEEGFQWRYRGKNGDLVAVSAMRYRTYADCMGSLEQICSADDVALYVPTRFALTRATAVEPPAAPRPPPRRKAEPAPARSFRPIGKSGAR